MRDREREGGRPRKETVKGRMNPSWDGGRQEGVAGERSGGGRKKDEGDEEGEPEGRRLASRTKTQVHIQGDVGRCPRVTSIKDGLPSTDGGDGDGDGGGSGCPETHCTSSRITRA